MTMPDNRLRCAEFVLNEALALNIRVGTDGDELVLIAPLKVPRETRVWFENELYKYKPEIIEVIQRKNAAPSREAPACDDEYADMIDDHVMRGAHDDETD
jgi:hypothetical protein